MIVDEACGMTETNEEHGARKVVNWGIDNPERSAILQLSHSGLTQSFQIHFALLPSSTTAAVTKTRDVLFRLHRCRQVDHASIRWSVCSKKVRLRRRKNSRFGEAVRDTPKPPQVGCATLLMLKGAHVSGGREKPSIVVPVEVHVGGERLGKLIQLTGNWSLSN